MVDERVGEHTRLVILGDWIYNYSYAVFGGENMSLQQFVRVKT